VIARSTVGEENMQATRPGHEAIGTSASIAVVTREINAPRASIRVEPKTVTNVLEKGKRVEKKENNVHNPTWSRIAERVSEFSRPSRGGDTTICTTKTKIREKPSQ